MTAGDDDVLAEMELEMLTVHWLAAVELNNLLAAGPTAEWYDAERVDVLLDRVRVFEAFR